MPKEEELRITVCSGTYTFIIYKNEWRVHCLRYDEPWMIFEQGYKALIAMMYTLHDAEEYAKQLSAENAKLKEELSEGNWDRDHPHVLRCRGKTKAEFYERLLALLPADFPMTCKHNIRSSVDEDGLCVSCGKDLNPLFEQHCGGCPVIAENAKLKEKLGDGEQKVKDDSDDNAKDGI